MTELIGASRRVFGKLTVKLATRSSLTHFTVLFNDSFMHLNVDGQRTF